MWNHPSFTTQRSLCLKREHKRLDVGSCQGEALRIGTEEDLEQTSKGKRALLKSLAVLCGIETCYEDAWGKRHEVEDDTLKALLAAFGYEVETFEDFLDIFHDLQERSCRRLIEPVQVVPVGISPVSVIVNVPESLAYGRYRWLLRFEDGSEAQGEGTLTALQHVDEYGFQENRYVRKRLDLCAPLPCGYHDLQVHVQGSSEERTARQRLILAPSRAYVPPSLRSGRKLWGLTGQLYSVRSNTNWGIGSFSDLKALIDWAADVGASFVGINPLCLLFPEDSSKVSPYGPSSRRFLQPWYVDVEAVPEFWECEEVRRWYAAKNTEDRRRKCQESSLVDYDGVWALKREALHKLFAFFLEHHLRRGSGRAQAFQRFVTQGGEDLQNYGVFHALDAHFRRQDPSLWGWHLWPKPYQDKNDKAVRDFVAEHRESVTFAQYVAWIAREQLAQCGHRSWERSLAVGIYGDLPVGVDPAGLDTWLDPDIYASNVRLGAPPDDFNPKGQEWGVCPFLPEALRDKAYEPFVALIRANMREFGALRIDHVMGLMRQFWIPAGQEARFGAYVRYPLEDLLGIVLLESERNQCAVVGEDLGTVPQRIREAMEKADVFGCRLGLFERMKDGSFPPPNHYPPHTLASFATHDLPTFEGFWEGTDLRVRKRLNLFPSPQVRKAMVRGRVSDKKALLSLLSSWGYQEESSKLKAKNPEEKEGRSQARAAAFYRYLAASESQLLAVSLEDLCGMVDQVNVPGTVHEHPNWRRKLPWDLNTLKEHPRVHAIISAVVAQRP